MGRYRAKNIAGILDRVLGRRGWQQGLREAEITLHWEEIAGQKIAEHAKPVKFTRNRLEVHCDHDVWRVEMEFLKPELLKKLAEEFGEGVVKEIYLK